MLRVSLLGEQVIADDETGAVLTRSPRSVALVAHLVVHAGRAQPRRVLAGHRSGGWSGVIVGVDPSPSQAEAISQWTRDYWEELHPTSAGGAYVNFMMEEGQDRVRASYGANYDRPAAVKRRYDPETVFHVN